MNSKYSDETQMGQRPGVICCSRKTPCCISITHHDDGMNLISYKCRVRRWHWWSV